MKEAFNRGTTVLGMISSGAIVLIILYVALFSIDETTGNSLAGCTKTFKGTVTGVACHESTYDISFTIEGKNKRYYINRGLEKGLSCEELRAKLVNKEVEISHATFVANKTTGHINRLAYNGEVVYSELK